MKKNLYIIGLFSCLAIIQIATPLSMIVRREITLRDGAQFRFRTAPVDPYDAFRGRYVALRIEKSEAPVPKGIKLGRNQKVYAIIEKDAEGFAKIASVTTQRPKGNAYIQAKVWYVDGKNVAHLQLPFSRYYMEEKAAPAAEAAYRKHSRRQTRDAYVVVRVKSGFAVLEEFYVGGKSISEFIKQGK